VNTIDKVFADPQVRAREMVVELLQPVSGRSERYIASPMKLSQTPVEYRRAAPALGEHTEEVLRELLDADAAEIADLRSAGAI
jgi:crotonobetainyl-CoA:carnitine CoA-transferase CaiB-like acyl-CoA transferase